MSDNETTTDENSAAVMDLLGPPPDEIPDAMPSKVLETVLLRFLARVIHADGKIDPKEMSALVDIAVQLGLAGEEARLILDDEVTAKSDVEQLARQIPDPGMRKEAYAMGCVMCCADGEAADSEKAVLMAFAKGAEIPEADATGILGKLTAAMEKAKAEGQA